MNSSVACMRTARALSLSLATSAGSAIDVFLATDGEESGAADTARGTGLLDGAAATAAAKAGPGAA